MLALYNSRKEIYLLFVVLGISSLFCGSIMFYMELLGSLAAGTEETLISNIPVGKFNYSRIILIIGYESLVSMTAS